MFSSENIPRMLTCLVIGLLLISLPSYKPISLLEKCYYWLPSVEGQWNVRHGFSLYWGCRTFFGDTILSWKGRPCCISLETKSVPGSAGPGVAGPLTPCALLFPTPTTAFTAPFSSSRSTACLPWWFISSCCDLQQRPPGLSGWFHKPRGHACKPLLFEKMCMLKSTVPYIQLSKPRCPTETARCKSFPRRKQFFLFTILRLFWPLSNLLLKMAQLVSYLRANCRIQETQFWHQILNLNSFFFNW